MGQLNALIRVVTQKVNIYVKKKFHYSLLTIGKEIWRAFCEILFCGFGFLFIVGAIGMGSSRGWSHWI